MARKPVSRIVRAAVKNIRHPILSARKRKECKITALKTQITAAEKRRNHLNKEAGATIGTVLHLYGNSAKAQLAAAHASEPYTREREAESAKIRDLTARLARLEGKKKRA